MTSDNHEQHALGTTVRQLRNAVERLVEMSRGPLLASERDLLDRNLSVVNDQLVALWARVHNPFDA